MVASSRSQFLPETDPERLAPYRVVGVSAIRSMLKDLVARRSVVALYPPRRFDNFALTQIVRFDDAELDLDLVADRALRDAVLADRGGVVVGLVETVKVQFSVESPRVVNAAGGPVLRFALPATAFRIQRRNAFRVRPLLKEPATCRLVDAGGTECVHPVLDFSIEGLALAVPAGVRLPERGGLLQDCEIEIGDHTRVRCDMVLRNVVEDAGLRQGARRVGFQFQRLSADAERKLQRVVMDIEQRSRALAAR